MNNEAFWRGFVKAASKTGLSAQQITYCIKRAASQPAFQSPTIPQGAGMNTGPTPGGMAGMSAQPMSGGQFGGLPQSPAGQGQQQGGVPLPWMLEQQHMQQLPQMPMPQSVTPTFNFGQQ
jgi:hypothetical protein